MQLNTLKTFYVCNCYFYENYFVPQINQHVTYKGRSEDFLREYKLQIDEYDETTRTEILDLLEREFQRRKLLGHITVKSTKWIKSNYEPLHKDLYSFQEEHIHPSFLKLVNYCKTKSANIEAATKMMKVLKPKRCYKFPIFTKIYCQKLIEELDNFERSESPKNRPNTMNRYGVLLNEIGLDEFINTLRTEYLNPIAKILFPEWVVNSLDSHKAFTVRYSKDGDLDLSEHYDNAEVTANISLTNDFEDSSLYFKSMRKETSVNPVEVKHTLGHAIFHRAQHIHGAMPISYGERCNLIIWMRSSSVRNKLCPMCDKLPTLVPQAGCGDGFTTIEMCSVV